MGRVVRRRVAGVGADEVLRAIDHVELGARQAIHFGSLALQEAEDVVEAAQKRRA